MNRALKILLTALENYMTHGVVVEKDGLDIPHSLALKIMGLINEIKDYLDSAK